MASNKTDETLIDVADAYSKTEQFVNKNGKNLTMIVLVIIGAILAYFLYQNFVVKPKNEEAASMMWKAEYYFGIDSLNLALNGDGNNYGFLDVADEYGSTPTGQLAKHYAGLCLMNMGKYGAAAEQLAAASIDDLMIESTRSGALGDCYIETGDYDKAISAYESSIANTANDFTTPIYLKKLGLAYEATGNYDKALDAFTRIKDDFAQTSAGREAEKYIARISAAMSSN